jgi:2',3'-cyclic-nucleotide 2'-phosphodiesterase (5'-nucleotidase family)
VDAGGWSEIKADRRRIGSELLLEGFDALGVEVVNVAGRDLLLGSSVFEGLSKSFAGNLISANIEQDGEPLFPTHVIVERQIGAKKVRIGITGTDWPKLANVTS